MAQETVSSEEQPSKHLTSFVRRYCERDVVCAQPQSSLQEIAKLMRDNHIGNVVIIDENTRPVGIVTDRDLVMKSFAQGRSPDELKAEDVMTREIAVGKINDPVEELVRIMRREGVGRLPIVDESGAVTAIITAKNLMSWLISQLNQLMEGAEKQQNKEMELIH